MGTPSEGNLGNAVENDLIPPHPGKCLRAVTGKGLLSLLCYPSLQPDCGHKRHKSHRPRSHAEAFLMRSAVGLTIAG